MDLKNIDKEIVKKFTVTLFGLIIAPLIVSYIIYITTKEKTEISFLKTETPIRIGEMGKEDIYILAKGDTLNSLFYYEISAENTGEVAMDEFLYIIDISGYDSSLKVYKSIIETEPRKDVHGHNGEILDSSIRWKVDLLNPKDKMKAQIVTNKKINPSIRENYKYLKTFDRGQKTKNVNLNYSVLILTSLLTVFLLALVNNFLSTYSYLRYRGKIKIISAIYGRNNNYADVTSKIEKMISEKKISVQVNNGLNDDIDPLPGEVKEIKISYMVKGTLKTRILQEYQELLFAELYN